jgi:hypothetical protein
MPKRRPRNRAQMPSSFIRLAQLEFPASSRRPIEVAGRVLLILPLNDALLIGEALDLGDTLEAGRILARALTAEAARANPRVRRLRGRHTGFLFKRCG